MNVSREEAAAALEDMEAAKAKFQTARRYAEFAPYLMTWGLIWLAANVATDLRPERSGLAWLVGIAVGLVITIYLTVRNARRWRSEHPTSRTAKHEIRRRAALLGTTLWLYFPSLALLLGPMSGRQANAFISITWAFIYMIAGAFIGWRIFAIGVVTAAAIVFGYLFVQSHFALWMAFVGGGSLIAGALWLRKI